MNASSCKYIPFEADHIKQAIIILLGSYLDKNGIFVKVNKNGVHLLVNTA